MFCSTPNSTAVPQAAGMQPPSGRCLKPLSSRSALITHRKAAHQTAAAAAPAPPHLQLQFSRQPTVSRRGTAVVVDGSSLLLTPLRHTGAPRWAGGEGKVCGCVCVCVCAVVGGVGVGVGWGGRRRRFACALMTPTSARRHAAFGPGLSPPHPTLGLSRLLPSMELLSHLVSVRSRAAAHVRRGRRAARPRRLPGCARPWGG